MTSALKKFTGTCFWIFTAVFVLWIGIAIYDMFAFSSYLFLALRESFALLVISLFVSLSPVVALALVWIIGLGALSHIIVKALEWVKGSEPNKVVEPITTRV